MTVLASLMLLAASSSGRCFELLADRNAGEPVASADVREMACPAKGGAPALRYDRTVGANVAGTALKAGDIIAKVQLGTAPAVRQGQRLTLASRTGSVTVERPVTALQSARPNDHRVFVQTDDGEILAVPIKIESADE